MRSAVQKLLILLFFYTALPLSAGALSCFAGLGGKIINGIKAGVALVQLDTTNIYKKTKTYKILTTDGRVLNLRFLGMKEKNSHLLHELKFNDLDTGEVVTLMPIDIASYIEIPKLKELIKEDLNHSYISEKEIKAKIDEVAASHVVSESGLATVVINPKELGAMNRDQTNSIKVNARLIAENLSAFDTQLATLFGRKPDHAPIYVQLINAEKEPAAHTYPQLVKINGIESWLMVIPYELAPEGVQGISIGTVLHERGHNITDKASSEHKSGLNYDSAVIEALADFTAAYHKADPGIARGHGDKASLRNLERGTYSRDEGDLTMQDPFDTINNGFLEHHLLSSFYSHPLWKIFVAAKAEGRADSTIPVIEKLFAVAKKFEPSHQDYRWAHWGEAYGISNEDTKSMANLEFFYACLYREAFIENTIGEKKLLEQAYLSANKKFTLNWDNIRSLAYALEAH